MKGGEVWHMRHIDVCGGCGERWPCAEKRRQVQRDVEKLYPDLKERRGE